MNPSQDQETNREQAAWNEAHDRVRDFLNTFALGDHAQVARLSLNLLDQARELHRQDPSREPVELVMAQVQKLTQEWLAANLELPHQTLSRLLTSGYIALLLSRANREAPETFLISPLPANLKESIQRTLLVTGPDLKISSMTPRHLDYGPMLTIARKTWHRWNGREIGFALLFWTAAYFIFYWCLSQIL
jgi:hypothetical protein